MFDIEVRFMVGGRPIGFDEFVGALAQRIAKEVGGEVQGLPHVRPLAVELPWQAQPEARKEPKRLAVSVDEAAKLLGVSPFTIRNYVASGRLRAVRVGRRVLVPMEVLEKVMVEGVSRGRR